MKENRPIAIVGATGFTGGLVVDALSQRFRKESRSIRLIGRNLSKLGELGNRVPNSKVFCVEDWSVERLADAITGCGSVISCAGPFCLAGIPVVQAAIQAGVPYCDSTGEQPFIRRIFEEFDAPAKKAKIPLVPAFGFDFIPGDLGASILTETNKDIERIEVVYLIEGEGSSVGTRKSAIEVMSRKGFQRINGKLCPELFGARKKIVTTSFGTKTAGSVPGGEVFTLPRHIDVSSVLCFMELPGAVSPASVQTAIIVRLLSLPFAKRFFLWAVSKGPSRLSNDERQRRVACHIEVLNKRGETKTLLIEGRDGYGFTAESLADLSIRMSEGLIKGCGVLAPSQVVVPREFLKDRRYTVSC